MKFLKIKKSLPEIILFILFFLFSWWLMWHTFDYKDGTIYIAAKAWSDFAAHLPLIRSFSWGKNFPPEYPLFPGEPIRYHFLFYFLVGMLEKIGLPLNWALNIPSLLGFFGLLLIIYLLARFIFEKKSVALLSVVFFLFNSSLSFLEFFRQHPFSLKTLSEIINNKVFPSFGPYDGKIVSAFWNLNIYTNQRHLGASYFLVLLVIYIIARTAKLKKKLSLCQIILLAIIVGLLPFFHKVAFLITGLILFSLLLYLPKLRKSVFFIGAIAGLLAIPQFAYQFNKGIPSIFFRPGYLISPPLTVFKFLSYWFLNLGLSLILIPLGFFLANRLAKKVFLAVLPLFLIGNLFQFSPEIAANHKFFNLFLIIGNMFTAWAIYLVWRKKIVGKLVVPVLIFLLTFSGIIDFFPIKNDFRYTIDDAPKNPDVLWIKENTPPDAVFLNSSFLYHPASIAGRKIFSGWLYFTWGVGYDSSKRERIRKDLLNPFALEELCQKARINNLSYLMINDKEQKAEIDMPINKLFFEQNLVRVYENYNSGYKIYLILESCVKFYD